MGKAISKPQDVCHSDEDTRALSDVRIDAPHILTEGDDPLAGEVQQAEPALAQECASADLPASAQQIRTHAVQLADHLSARQQDLDRREAEVNARVAELEENQRSARLWLAQRRAELEDREAEWAKQRREAEVDLQHCHVSWERDYQDRVAALEKRERVLSDANREESEKGLAVREEAVAKREEELKSLAEQLQAQAEEQRQTLDALESGKKQLKRAEAQVDSLHEEAEEIHQQLSEDRCRWREHVESERQLLAGERRREMEELEQKRLMLRRRSEQVDRSRAALQRMREDLRRMHRETLEIRLASEELWVQLSEMTPAAVANRLLEQLRAKLAEQYRLAGGELAEQKEELTAIHAELGEFHQKLVYDRQDFEQWAARRQAEIERKAAELASRKELLDRQEADLCSRLLQSQRERLANGRDADRDRADLPDSRTVAVAG